MSDRYSSLSDIKGLDNTNVSNGNNFSCMLDGSSSLLNIKGIQNWISSKFNFLNLK